MLVFQQGNNCDYQKSGGAECTQGFICNHSITSLSREHPSTVSQASLTSLYHHYEYFTIFFCLSFLFVIYLLSSLTYTSIFPYHSSLNWLPCCILFKLVFCSSCLFMSFHVFHVFSCLSMSFMSFHVFHVFSCFSMFFLFSSIFSTSLFHSNTFLSLSGIFSCPAAGFVCKMCMEILVPCMGILSMVIK